nr:hypothetical protein [Tanacetum cinerariifolium]
PQIVSAAKLPILNPNEFDLWKMRIEQYFLMTDYSLWKVILNGDSPAPTRVVDGVLQPLKFNSHKDAMTLMEAIKKRFRGNTETKKVQKTLLKQQYENFTGFSSESLDQIHDRLQNLISQLEILGVSLPQKDTNFNLKIYEVEVKSSSSARTTTQNIAFVSSSNTNNTNEPVSAAASVSTINADDLEEMDLKWQISMLTGHFVRECRSLKDIRRNGAAEPQRRNVPVKTSTSNALVSQCDGVRSYDWSFQAEEEPTNYALMAFSSSSSSSDTEVVSCSKACTKAYAQLQSHYDKLTADFQKSQFDVISYQTCLEFVKARLLVYQQNKSVFEEGIKLLKLEVQLRDNALVSLRQNLEKAEQERDDLKLKLEKFQTFSKNLSDLLASQTHAKTGLGYTSQVFTPAMFDCDDYLSSGSDESLPPSPIYDRYQSGNGYHVVHPPYTGTFMPPKPDLVFNNVPNAVETDHHAFNAKLSPTKPDQDLSHTNRPSAPIIRDWVSDSEDESKTKAPLNVPSFVQSTEQVKSPRPSVQHVETSIPATTPNPASPKPISNGKCRNRKACFVCNSLDHLIKDCDYHEKKMAPPTARNHAYRGNHKPVSTAVFKLKVTRPRHAKPIITKTNSPTRRHINRSPSLKASNSPPRVTAIQAPVVNAAQGMQRK